MFSTPACTTGSAAVETTPAARNRIVTLIVAFGVAVALLFAPVLATAAHATTAHTAVKHRTAAQVGHAWARHMLDQLNQERRVNHLPALVMNTRLINSAHGHNLDMANKNTMSHQLPGEAFFADRITKAGYKWNYAGENIGWNSVETRAGLADLETQMYNEKAPDNGHRLNILSKNFHDVGIDVYFDTTNHKMWFTQDFGHQA